MWHLVRLNNKKDKEQAEKELNGYGGGHYALERLVEMYHTQPAIALLLRTHVPDAYLIEERPETEECLGKLCGQGGVFQRIRHRNGTSGHVKLSQEEFDQLILVLQTPAHYRVWAANEPTHGELKALTLPHGPLQGLKGKFLNTRTPAAKRFYLTVLSLIHLEIRIPIADIRRTRKEEGVILSYLADEQTPHWYLLSATREEYIERMLGNTLNAWPPREEAEPTITERLLPDGQRRMQTIRYIYRAVYRRYDKEGNPQEINLMPNYYFFRTTRYDLETFRGTGFDSHIYILRNSDGTPAAIPEVQINRFARFLQERSDAAEVLYQDYREGDVARIALGTEVDNEIEGTVQIVTKKHVVLVSDNGFKINVRKGR